MIQLHTVYIIQMGERLICAEAIAQRLQPLAPAKILDDTDVSTINMNKVYFMAHLLLDVYGAAAITYTFSLQRWFDHSTWP